MGAEAVAGVRGVAVADGAAGNVMGHGAVARPMVEEVTMRTFDAWADAGRGKGMEDGHALTGVPAVDGLRVGNGGWFLDLGCGNGWAARRVTARSAGTRGIGVDASARMVREARRTSLEAGVDTVDFVRASFEHLPFRDGAFSGAFSMEALYYASDLPRALREFCRALAPGAHARIVVDYYGENAASHSWPTDVGVPMSLLEEAAWAKAVEAAGFRSARTERLRVPADHARAVKQPWTAEEGSLLVDVTR